MLFPKNLQQTIEDAGMIAVATVENAAHARPLSEALLAGGIRILELTLRTPAALKALEIIVREVPEMIVGAGTVLSPLQVRQVKECGAAFGVAPGTNPRVLQAAAELGLPFAPGVMTPSDIETALEYRASLLKYFPAAQAGGVAHLRAIAMPYTSLGLRYIPLGGLQADAMDAYLQEPIVAALGGSWLTPPHALAEGDWKQITQRAADACRRVAEVRGRRA